MKLAQHPKLEALCADYVLGTMSPRTRNRFGRALEVEPEVAATYESVIKQFPMAYPGITPEVPSEGVWTQITQSLGLQRKFEDAVTDWTPASVPASKAGLSTWARLTNYLFPESQGKVPFWAIGVSLATLVMVVGTGTFLFPPHWSEGGQQIAQVGNQIVASVFSEVHASTIQVSIKNPQGEFKYSSELVANAASNQVLQLWIIPKNSSTPVSVGLLKDGQSIPVDLPKFIPDLKEGGTLAVSVEPEGGSPKAGPTGAVTILHKA